MGNTKNVPLMLYSLVGLSVIASAIGDPLHKEKSRLEAVNIGETKVKVEIILDSSPPETIIVQDSFGNSARVSVSYPQLPPKCVNCGRYGHLMNRCPRLITKKSQAFKGREIKSPSIPKGVDSSSESPPQIPANGPIIKDPDPPSESSSLPNQCARSRSPTCPRTRAKSTPPVIPAGQEVKVLKRSSPKAAPKAPLATSTEEKCNVVTA
ncbi:hypothetical protein EUTSA_v10027414mg, partial [Eutrema salsugineum]